jgi:linoleoyl-CoA desaturase
MKTRTARFTPPLDFSSDKTFQNELRRRVTEYLRASGAPGRDHPAMYLKSAIILLTFIISYLYLVFFASSVWVSAPAALLLSLSVAGIGFNIQHDGGHKAYSKNDKVNRAAALTMDLIGGSSYVWWWKHVAFHHKYVNIAGYDPDVEAGPFVRLAPFQKRRWFHRWQHIYMWPV